MRRIGSGARPKRVCSSLAILTSSIICSVVMSAPQANANCGFEDARIDKVNQFMETGFGTLALRYGSRFYVLRRGRCFKVSSINTEMHFYVNHSSSSEERGFLAVHAALFDPDNLQNIIFLFRNAGDWNGSGGASRKYESRHEAPHAKFNSDLSLDYNSFNGKYHDGVEPWHTELRNRDRKYETYDTQSNFRVKKDFLDALANNKGGLRTQNYLISFTTLGNAPKNDQPERPLDFEMKALGAKCIFLRLSGSPNVAAELSGEYTIALNGTETCDATISQLQGIGFFEWLFAIRR